MIIAGAGLGLRREMLPELSEGLPDEVDFWEVAPENWMTLGGKYQRAFAEIARDNALTTHGLSLSIGSPDALDHRFIRDIAHFLDTYQIPLYSEHLSYCSAKGHMYDLMPIPFTPQAVSYVSDRIQQAQDILKRPLILENVSYYLAPGQEMSELCFIKEILQRSGCELLLDVNNVYVNSINHDYSPVDFIEALPTNKIVYGHIAGHFDEADDLKVDTHGASVKEEVWSLLGLAYRKHGVFPTLLERDFNIPPIEELLIEVRRIKALQQANASPLNEKRA